MSGSARGVAFEVLERVERDRAFAELALAGALRRTDLERRDRAFATELCYGTLRYRGRLDAMLVQCLDRPFERVEPAVRNLLRLGAYQITHLSKNEPWAGVSETVDVARAVGKTRATGFVNAILRKVAAKVEADGFEFPALADDPVAHVSQFGSLPEWLAERLVKQLGADEAAAFAAANLNAPPRTVRVRGGHDVEDVTKRLRGRVGAWAPRAATDLRTDPVRDSGFNKGYWTVQDEASQLIPLLVGARERATVIDCCAAPGSKTMQLAEAVGPRGEVIAMDVHGSRIGLIRRAAERLEIKNVRVLERDAAQSFDLRGPQRYPHILVDAPCSGLGALRRNPDARWRLHPDDIARAATTQEAILANAARYVLPGGSLVYSVCTFTPEETVGILEPFLTKHPDFTVDDPRPFLPEPAQALVDANGALATWPHKHGCDGFWAVRLVRS